MQMRALALAALLAAPAASQVPVATGHDRFEVVLDRTIATPPAQVYDRLVHVETWWSSSHTYSGDAANLNLEARAGGCWCENWAGGSVEHGRVIAALPGKLLRIAGGLGPLQERPAVAVLSFTLTPVNGGAATAVALRYRVMGPVGDLGPPVTAVLGEQMERLVKAAATPLP